MPRRILYYPNIVKAEGRGKSKTLFLILGYAEAASYNIIQIYEKPRAEANQKHCF